MASGAGTGGGPRWSAWRLIPWGVAAGLLLLPAVAMQFTAEVNWDETDFIVMGMLLFTACAVFEVGARLRGGWAYRAGVGLAVLAAFLLIWVNLAVGVIGSEDDPANQMFLGVLGVLLVGSVLSRLRPRGMSRTLVATAVAQAAVAVVALAGGDNIFPMTIAWGGMWLGSAWLFRKAGANEGVVGAEGLEPPTRPL